MKHTGKLKNVTLSIASQMPEKYAEEILAPLTPAKVGNSVGKGWDGVKKGIVPSSQKWLKDFVSVKSFSEL